MDVTPLFLGLEIVDGVMTAYIPKQYNSEMTGTKLKHQECIEDDEHDWHGHKNGAGNFCLIHVSLVPVLNVVGEPVYSNLLILLFSRPPDRTLVKSLSLIDNIVCHYDDHDDEYYDNLNPPLLHVVDILSFQPSLVLGGNVNSPVVGGCSVVFRSHKNYGQQRRRSITLIPWSMKRRDDRVKSSRRVNRPPGRSLVKSLSFIDNVVCQYDDHDDEYYDLNPSLLYAVDTIPNACKKIRLNNNRMFLNVFCVIKCLEE
ncbi:hypothetical protein L1987_33520 [Smallanthus sonchifolius]|uniref:Uncharacterized protein n=1 Tax=Smallanthus sonchifolius TaxID=185202 RepID=A0ACB9HQR9_9ASTR|nr:hypothetical protein L1987_33520 [Smallanthus sonchifolius]